MNKTVKICWTGALVFLLVEAGIASAASPGTADIRLSENIRSEAAASSFIHPKLGAVSGQVLRVESDNGRRNILKGAVKLEGDAGVSKDSLVEAKFKNQALADEDGGERETQSPDEGSGFLWSPGFYGWEGCSEMYDWFIDMNDWIIDLFLHHDDFTITRCTFSASCEGGYSLETAEWALRWAWLKRWLIGAPDLPNTICVPFTGYEYDNICTNSPSVATCGMGGNTMCSSYMLFHDEEMIDPAGLLNCQGGQAPHCEAWGTVWWQDYSGGR